MRPATSHGCWVASTKRCKDAGSPDSGPIGATEDAAARSVIAGQKPCDVAGCVTTLALVTLQGKRIFVTGGAGFIATTLARRLLDENEIVAVDNLHRDALSATDLADHPNFTFLQGDVLDADLVQEAARGATHIVHCAAIAGVDTVDRLGRRGALDVRGIEARR